MAVSMGSERICQLLIDYHSTRVRRMINLVNASFGAGSIEIRGSLFTQQELLDTNDSPLGVQGVPKFTGGLLFSKGQVEDFGREMLEWMKAPDTDGGGGGFDVGDLPKIMVIENEYLSLLKSEFVNRYNFRARKRVCVVWVGGGGGGGEWVHRFRYWVCIHTYIQDVVFSAKFVPLVENKILKESFVLFNPILIMHCIFSEVEAAQQTAYFVPHHDFQSTQPLPSNQ